MRNRVGSQESDRHSVWSGDHRIRFRVAGRRVDNAGSHPLGRGLLRRHPDWDNGGGEETRTTLAGHRRDTGE